MKNRNLMGLVRSASCFAMLALCGAIKFAFGQGAILPEDKPNLARAEKAADLFYRRVARAKNFDNVWKQYRAANYACFLENNPFEPEGDAVFTDQEREFYINAAMKVFFLSTAYGFSVERHNVDPSPRMFPPEVRKASKSARYLRYDLPDAEPPVPKNSTELKEMVAEMNRFAKMYQRAMPRNATINSTWRWNMRKMRGVGGNTYSGVREGSTEDCVASGAKIFIIQRGPIQFYFTEEGGRMKIAQMGIGN